MATLIAKTHCDACVKVIKSISGVKSASASADKKTTTVICDDKDKEKVKIEIKKAGYPVA
jgi:copper chaperone CopZ